MGRREVAADRHAYRNALVNDLPTRRAFNRRGAAALDRLIDDAVAQQAAEREASYRAARARETVERVFRGTITRDDLTQRLTEVPSGVAVRDDTGWHVLLKLNAVSVTVPWGGTRTVRIDRLLEVRS